MHRSIKVRPCLLAFLIGLFFLAGIPADVMADYDTDISAIELDDLLGDIVMSVLRYKSLISSRSFRYFSIASGFIPSPVVVTVSLHPVVAKDVDSLDVD